jgi:DNA-binding NarL/FixJ family response regulator
MEATIHAPRDAAPLGTVVPLTGRARTGGGGATTRVALAEGERLARAGLRALLQEDPAIAVVAEAASADEALALAEDCAADVALVAVQRPGPDALDPVRRMLADAGRPRPKVLVLTEEPADAELFGAIRAGACGLLLRDSDAAELRRAVHAVARGEATLSPGLTRRLLDEVAAQPDPDLPAPEDLDELTAREREVLALVAAGLSNGEIAERLVVSPATAKTHVSRAMIKLHARDRAKLVRIAYESGLVLPRVRRADAPFPGARRSLAAA